MARRRSKTRTRSGPTLTRDPYLSLLERVVGYNARPARRAARSRLNALADRRLWTPHRRAIAATVGKPEFVVRRSIRRAVPRGLAFANPRVVLACARRAIRKQVMHAKGAAGSPRIARKKKKRNELSRFSCKG